MNKTLKDIYCDVLDRIYLNSRLEARKLETARKQAIKDEELKTLIEKVFENSEYYDVYIKKDTVELCIDEMPEDRGLRKNLFNRIEIDIV